MPRRRDARFLIMRFGGIAAFTSFGELAPLVRWVTVNNVRATEVSPYEAVVAAYERIFRADREWDAERVPPIQVFARGGRENIVNGHHRFAAAKRAGLVAVPVIDVDAMRHYDHAEYRAAVRRLRREAGLRVDWE